MTAPSYGQAFAGLYKAHWDQWSRLAWPRLRPHLPSADIAGRRWLDLCCGTGSLLRLTTEAGFEAVGVDRSPHQIAHARRNVPGAQLIEADILDLDIDGRFAVVTSIFDSLNYLARPGDLGRLFGWVRRHLDDAGVFVFDVRTSAGFGAERTRVVRAGKDIVAFEPAYDRATGIYALTVTGFVARGASHRRFDEVHTQRAYDAGEIGDLLAGAGLQHTIRDFDTGRAVRRSTRRLWCVCHPVI